jgi:hypothetical protein
MPVLTEKAVLVAAVDRIIAAAQRLSIPLFPLQ